MCVRSFPVILAERFSGAGARLRPARVVLALLAAVLICACCHAQDAASRDIFGIAVSAEGDVAFVDKVSDSVIVQPGDGSRAFSIGRQEELVDPEGVAFGPDGAIVVADTGNHRVRVFDAKGKLVYSLGEHGEGDGQFSGPVDVAVDSNGTLYVTDGGNNRLQLFTKDGDFLTTFGEAGIGHGQFRGPTGIAVDSRDRVLVVDCLNGRVEIFTQGDRAGELEYASTIYGFFGPQGISVGPEDRIVVAEGWGWGIKVFDADGKPIGRLNQWELDGLKAPRDAAMLPSGDVCIAVPESGSLLIAKRNSLVPFERRREMRGLAVDADGRLIVAEEAYNIVRTLDENGATLHEFGYWGAEPGRLAGPRGLAFTPDGDLVIVDSGNCRISIMSPEGKPLLEFGARGGGNGEFADARGVCVDDDGRIYVADSGNHRIQIFDHYGSFIAAFGSEGDAEGKFKAPHDVAIDPKGRLVIADTENARLQVFSFDKATSRPAFVKASRKNFGFFTDLAFADDGRLFGVEARESAIKQIDLDNFKIAKEFRAHCVGRVRAPQALAVRGDAVYIADTDNDRIIQTNLDLADPEINVIDVTRTSAAIEWTSPVSRPSTVEYGLTDEFGTTLASAASSTEHRVEITGLEPNTRYHFRIAAPLPVYLGDEQAVSQVFVTKPDEGLTQYLNLPIAVLVYRETTFNDMYPAADHPDVQSPPPLTDEDVAAIKQELEEVRLFYWRHSKMKLNVAFDVIEITKPLGLKDIAPEPQPTYWLGPNDRVVADLETALAAKGKTPFDYYGVMTLYPWRDQETGSVRFRGWAAAGTFGLPCPWAKEDYVNALAYSEVFLFMHRIEQLDWYVGFELHHQVENSIKWSFDWDHPSAELPHEVAGQFGQDHDFIAHVLHSVPAAQWLRLRHGVVACTADADQDGVPDRDASVPIDEQRLGSRTDSTDSDNDGLSDLDEATLGLFGCCDPNDSDTDDDGVNDGDDPYPLDRIHTTVARKAPTIDGVLEGGEWDLAATFSDGEDGEVFVYLSWDEDRFYVAVADPKANRNIVTLNFDMMSDGWFQGADNVSILCHGNSCNWQGRDCSGEEQYGRFMPVELTHQTVLNDDTYVTEIAIPKGGKLEMQLHAGSTIGLEVRMGEAPGRDSRPVFSPGIVQFELK